MGPDIALPAPRDAHRALAAWTVADVVGLLGYAEGFGLACGGLGLAADPVVAVRRAVEGVVTGRWPWVDGALVAHVRVVVRDHAVAELERRTANGNGPLSALQLGSLAPLCVAAHVAGCVLATMRSKDGSITALATGVREELRRVGVEVAGSGDDAAM